MDTTTLIGLYFIISLVGVVIAAYIFKWICISPLINELAASRKLMGMHSVQENILSREQVEKIELDLKDRNTKI